MNAAATQPTEVWLQAPSVLADMSLVYAEQGTVPKQPIFSNLGDRG